MHRRAFLTALTAATTTVAVGLPRTPALAAMRPVPARVTRLPLAGARSRPLSTGVFSLVGLTWRRDRRVSGVDVTVRVRSRGTWSAWQHLHIDPDGPDQGSTDDGAAQRDGTAPLWVGPSDGVEVRLGRRSGAAPRDVRIELVDPGASPADSAYRRAALVRPVDDGRPTIITRAEWGADESLRRGEPTYTGLPKVGFVHHTATANGYSESQAAAMVRSVYAFHTQSRGWTDIGYNFLVDRFGRIYEGRAGGVDQPVLGTHTGGHNSNTFAVSLLGNYTSSPPPAVALAAVQEVLAWKLGAVYRDPGGTTQLTSAGGGTSRFAAGTTNTFNVVSGHRDAGTTSCPGSATYSRMGDIRRGVKALIGAGFVAPALVGSAQRSAGDTAPFAVTARTLSPMDWTLTVTRGGQVVRRLTGTADGALTAAWDLRYEGGLPALPGTHVIRLTGQVGIGLDVDEARPWQTMVNVAGTGPSRWRPISR